MNKYIQCTVFLVLLYSNAFELKNILRCSCLWTLVVALVLSKVERKFFFLVKFNLRNKCNTSAPTNLISELSTCRYRISPFQTKLTSQFTYIYIYMYIILILSILWLLLLEGFRQTRKQLYFTGIENVHFPACHTRFRGFYHRYYATTILCF